MNKTTEQATFTSAHITHALIQCPRGFVNERDVYPIPADFVDIAEYIARRANPEGDARYTRLEPLADTCSSDRSRMGAQLTPHTVESWRGFLCEMFAPLTCYDDNAPDWPFSMDAVNAFHSVL